MAVRPSCPILVIHDDDAFRKSLIKSLDRKHFSVTFTTDEGALQQLEHPERPFHVILLSVDLRSGRGMRALEFLRDHRNGSSAHVILIGEADPELRAHATFANETLLKPVDPDYVADRAQAYC